MHLYRKVLSIRAQNVNENETTQFDLQREGSTRERCTGVILHARLIFNIRKTASDIAASPSISLHQFIRFAKRAGPDPLDLFPWRSFSENCPAAAQTARDAAAGGGNSHTARTRRLSQFAGAAGAAESIERVQVARQPRKAK